MPKENLKETKVLEEKEELKAENTTDKVNSKPGKP